MIYLRFLYILFTLSVTACGMYEPFSKASLSPSPSGSPSVAINRLPDEPSPTPTATETSVTPSESVSPTPSPSPSSSVTPTMSPDQVAQLVKDVLGIKPCSNLADLPEEVVAQILAVKPVKYNSVPTDKSYYYYINNIDGNGDGFSYLIYFDENNLIWGVTGSVDENLKPVQSTAINISWFCASHLTQK